MAESGFLLSDIPFPRKKQPLPLILQEGGSGLTGKYQPDGLRMARETPSWHRPRDH
jgi:hypothetical protein